MGLPETWVDTETAGYCLHCEKLLENLVIRWTLASLLSFTHCRSHPFVFWSNILLYAIHYFETGAWISFSVCTLWSTFSIPMPKSYLMDDSFSVCDSRQLLFVAPYCYVTHQASWFYLISGCLATIIHIFPDLWKKFRYRGCDILHQTLNQNQLLQQALLHMLCDHSLHCHQDLAPHAGVSGRGPPFSALWVTRFPLHCTSHFLISFNGIYTWYLLTLTDF